MSTAVDAAVEKPAEQTETQDDGQQQLPPLPGRDTGIKERPGVRDIAAELGAPKNEKVEAIWAKLSTGRLVSASSRATRGGASMPASAEYGKAARLSAPTTRESSLASLCQRVTEASPPCDPDRNWMVGLKQGKPKERSAGGHSAAASAAMQAVKAASSINTAKAAGKVAVVEKVNFAGKEIEVASEVSTEALGKRKLPPKPTGLDALLASLQGPKKISVLDKSRSDWKGFKSSDAEVDEELEAYKKSTDKFLDKQEFLQNAELRQYELERDARLASDARTRGRV